HRVTPRRSRTRRADRCLGRPAGGTRAGGVRDGHPGHPSLTPRAPQPVKVGACGTGTAGAATGGVTCPPAGGASGSNVGSDTTCVGSGVDVGGVVGGGVWPPPVSVHSGTATTSL